LTKENYFMRNIIILGVAAVALAACGSGSSGGSAASSGPVKREAGSWKTDLKLVKFDMPGMPPKMAEGMKTMMEGASGMEACVTPEQAAKEDIAKELSKGPSNGASCDFSKQEVSGGKIDVAGTCKDSSGRAMQLTMTGTMESKKTDVNMKISSPAPTGQGNLDMEMHVVSTHVGPCKAG
jgi:hypothetical protein